jgi:Na+/H+-translocating membrane pyrophosphatase
MKGRLKHPQQAGVYVSVTVRGLVQRAPPNIAVAVVVVVVFVLLWLASFHTLIVFIAAAAAAAATGVAEMETANWDAAIQSL